MRWLALLALVALSACSGSNVAADCPELAGFNPDHAATDASRVAADQPHLLGVYGFTAEVPGRVRDDLPVRMIEGTSDHECEELNARTREYARRFNEAVQAHTRR